jgi:glutathione S-transferase
VPPQDLDDLEQPFRAPHAAAALPLLSSAVADIDALAAWLGDRPFFMGPTPTKIDATVHAFVCNFLAEPFTTPLKDATRRHANLVAYNERMLQRFFPRQAAAA